MRDLRLLGEAFAVVVVTWLLLGWPIDRAIAQADGSITWIPYAHSALRAGPDWTDHLYRFGVLGGSAMHDAAGTPPLLQLCAWLGLGATNTANLSSIFVQVCFGFFGLRLVEALATEWSAAPRMLAITERIATIWLTSFAPVLAWRVAYGHDNLLLGLLPWITLVSLWAIARTGAVSITALAFGCFAIANGVSGLGPQTLVYSAVFGAPIAIALVWPRRAARVWTRDHGFVLAAAAIAILLMLPRLASMLHYQLGDDAGRGIGHALVYSYGDSRVLDWLLGVPWTERLSTRWPGAIPGHETNYPLGPLIALAILAWPRRSSRRLAIGAAASGVLAILFALDVPPFSQILLALPMLESFRVPARAILPLLVLLPSLALASLWAREGSPSPRNGWIAVAIAAAVIVLARAVPALAREPAAWAGCIALGAFARWRPGRQSVAAIAIVGGLGVAAFDERVPHDVAHGRIEDGPQQIADAVYAQAPEARSPLVRVQLPAAPMPFKMSTAFAAGLGSLDGAWFPPRRFLDLLGALSGTPLPPTTGVFALTALREFPVLQQLYNVHHVVSVRTSAIEELPPTPGAAWFPRELRVIESPDELRRDIVRAGAVQATGFVLRSDKAPVPPPSADCARARVGEVSVDALGQRATLAVTTPAACVLIVATNYVSTLRARAASEELAVFPIDIALTGIVVPRGTHQIVLAPTAYTPWWSTLAWWCGLAGFVGLAVLFGLRAYRVSVVRSAADVPAR